MTNRLYSELVALWESSNKDPNSKVFGISDNVRNSFKSACKEAGIKHGGLDGMTIHSLRHTAATRLVQGQMPIQMVGRILGHTQVNTTYRYLSANAEIAQQAAAIFDALQSATGKLQETSEMIN
jgi:integrase